MTSIKAHLLPYLARRQFAKLPSTAPRVETAVGADGSPVGARQSLILNDLVMVIEKVFHVFCCRYFSAELLIFLDCHSKFIQQLAASIQ